MSKFIKVLQDFALLIARVALGAIMVTHAWRRWQVDGIESQISYLVQHGVPWSEYVAWSAIVGEAIGGLFLIVGVLTPLVGLGFLVEQILIIAWTNWYRGLPVHNGGYEYQVVIGVLSLVFLAFGAGRASVDHLFRRSPRDEDDLEDPESTA